MTEEHVVFQRWAPTHSGSVSFGFCFLRKERVAKLALAFSPPTPSPPVWAQGLCQLTLCFPGCHQASDAVLAAATADEALGVPQQPACTSCCPRRCSGWEWACPAPWARYPTGLPSAHTPRAFGDQASTHLLGVNGRSPLLKKQRARPVTQAQLGHGIASVARTQALRPCWLTSDPHPVQS